jgi:hypothetical protein
MDPLSIAASTITLVETTGKIYSFLKSIPHADAKLTALCAELNSLTDFIQSIDGMLSKCRRSPLAFVSVDNDLWAQCYNALSDCQKTLDDLAVLIDGMKKPNLSNTILRRTRLAAQMHLRGQVLVSFRERLTTSNTSLQTLLQVLNV